MESAAETGVTVVELDLTSHTGHESRREPLAGPKRLTNHSGSHSVDLGFLFFFVLLLLYTE